jgi:hypothetical protein
MLAELNYVQMMCLGGDISFHFAGIIMIDFSDFSQLGPLLLD